MLLWSQQQEKYLILIPIATKNELNRKWNIERLVGEVFREKIMKAKLKPVIIGNFVEEVLNVLQFKLLCVWSSNTLSYRSGGNSDSLSLSQASVLHKNSHYSKIFGKFAST